MSNLEQRPGPTFEAHYRRLVARGEKQLWTAEDEKRLEQKVRRIKREKSSEGPTSR